MNLTMHVESLMARISPHLGLSSRKRRDDEVAPREDTLPLMPQPGPMKPSDYTAAPLRAEPIARLRTLTADALRLAVSAASEGSQRDGELQALMGEACEIARGNAVRVEQLLILIKGAWFELPEAQRLDPSDAGNLRTSVVSLCISEYFAPGRKAQGSSEIRQ